MKTKNKILYSAVVLFGLLFATSCTEDSAGISKTTDLPAFNLIGGDMGVALGEPYVDNFTVTMNGKDIKAQTTVTGTVDVNTAGPYVIKYEAKSAEGFVRKAERLVVVYDKSSISTADISGKYKSNILRTNTTSGATKKLGPFIVNIKKISDGLFYIDDLLGGWYNFGSEYGDGYAGSGYIVLKADNTISVASSKLRVWDDTVSLFATSSYDPATGTILINSIMDAATYLEFAVTLTK